MTHANAPRNVDGRRRLVDDVELDRSLTSRRQTRRLGPDGVSMGVTMTKPWPQP
ncbi:hypothetical protein MCBG_01459 [Micromonospora sp. M42]|nr:hypothetical protein MCBG_01459 [Micromonospora sp. M42]